MPAGNELSVMLCSTVEGVPPKRGAVVAQCSLQHRLFRPWAVAFIGLAISVTLWGFGYKLSRYSPDSDTTSLALYAKLWDKHQELAPAGAPATLPDQPQLQSALHAVLILVYKIPELEHDALRPPDQCRHVPDSFCTVVPLRSPPDSRAA